MAPRFGGIIPPMVTPFTADEELDEAAFRAEVRVLLAAGVHGLAVGGSTGEGHTLSIAETCQLARAARDFREKGPAFATSAGLLSLHWLAQGYGYEITGADVWEAYRATLAAAEAAFALVK